MGLGRGEGPELVRFAGGEQVLPVGAPAVGDTYVAQFDGWTAASLEGRVRAAFQSMSVQHGKRLRVGRAA